MSHMYITDQLRDEVDKDSFKLTRVFSAQDQKQVKRQGCTTLVAKLCLQMGYKARFFRPFGVGAQCQELTYREMLSGQCVALVCYLQRLLCAVKQETESRQGLPEPLAVHRTEREMWRQYMVDGMTELVASVQRIGTRSLFINHHSQSVVGRVRLCCGAEL